MGEQAHSLVSLARQTVETYVLEHTILAADTVALPAFANRQAGVFVSIHLKDHSLRGCIGTIQATQPNIIAETIANAISAATRDPRFQPITANELPELVYSISLLHEPEQIYSLDQLDPQKYGVIVVSGQRRGLLLPALEGITTVEEQVGHAMYKGGIRPGETISLYRFQVDAYQEESL